MSLHGCQIRFAVPARAGADTQDLHGDCALVTAESVRTTSEPLPPCQVKVT